MSRRLIASLTLLFAAVTLTAVFSAAGLASGDAAKSQLVVLEDDVPPSLDYDGGAAASPFLIEGIQNIMEPLVTYPSKKVGDVLTLNYKIKQNQFVPRLAESYKQNGLVWTFKLRKGVKSCTGNELTADDVVYTWARAKSVSGVSPVAWFLGNVAGVLPIDPVLPNAKPAAKQLHGEVVKVDKYTVRFKQLHPNELFPRVNQIHALFIFDQVEMKKHATASDPWSHQYTETTNAPSFGPYCVSKWNKGTEIDYQANPNYYRGQPQFKTVIVRKVPSDSSRIASLLSGDADMVTNLTPQEYAKVESSGKAKVVGWKNNKITFMGFNSKFAPWNLKNNQLIRQAVAYAVPYNDILKSDYLGTATKWNGLCESTYNGFVPIAKYSTNVAKAKALLAKAGYPGGKGLPTQGLVLNYVAERRALLEPIANRIKTALARIGMPLTLSPLSQTEYSQKFLTKLDAQMFLSDLDRPLGPDVGYCSLLFYVSRAKGGLVTGANYSNPKFDALYAQSSTTVGAKRLAVLKQMQQILMNDLPFVPLAEVQSRLAMRKDITNWQGTGLDQLSFFEFKSK